MPKHLINQFFEASKSDLERCFNFDGHLKKVTVAEKIEAGQVWIATLGERLIGYLRFNLFWDEIPFINLIKVLESERRKGVGKELVATWESKMAAKGFRTILTSSLADEQGQFFWRSIGYVDSGALLLPSEAAEIIFRKEIGTKKETADLSV